MKPEPLIVIGASGMGREAIWLARSLPERWDVCGILDDSEEKRAKEVDGVPVLGAISEWNRWKERRFVIAVGSPRTRKAIYDLMHGSGAPQFATLVHPSVQRGPSVVIGEGTIVAAGSILTVDVVLGRQCIVNVVSSISHECRIGDFCTLAPHAAIAGNVRLEDGVEVGIGARVVQGISMGAGSMLAAGSIATKDIPNGSFAAGSPARHVRKLASF